MRLGSLDAEEGELARLVTQRATLWRHGDRHRIAGFCDVRDLITFGAAHTSRQQAIDERHNPKGAEGTCIKAQRVSVREWLEDKQIVERPCHKEEPHQTVGPAPEVIGNEGRDGDHDKDQDAIEAEFSEGFGQFHQGGFAPKTIHFCVNRVVQQDCSHGANPQPFVQDIPAIQAAEDGFDTGPAGGNHLQECHGNQSPNAKILTEQRDHIPTLRNFWPPDDRNGQGGSGDNESERAQRHGAVPVFGK